MRPTGKAKTAGIVGWPVGHSKSPRLHGYWLDRLGLDGAYIPLPVRPEDFAATIRSLGKAGFSGVNVTVPHKQAALALADEVDPVARRIGAVNTLIFRPDGTLFGRNTDALGFLAHLRHSVPGFEASVAPAVLLGSGGGARAIAATLVEAGVPELRMVCRTVATGQTLANAIGGAIRVLPWSEREAALEGAGLLANATSLGMMGQPPLEIALDRLPKTAVVDDIVYNPLETGLLAAARARGNRVVDGIGMLLHQGRPAFEAFFGVLPEIDDELRALMLAP